MGINLIYVYLPKQGVCKPSGMPSGETLKGLADDRGSRNADKTNVTEGFGVYLLRPHFLKRVCGECVGKGFVYGRASVDGKFQYVLFPCLDCNGHGFMMEPLD